MTDYDPTNSAGKKSNPNAPARQTWWHDQFIEKLSQTRSVTHACKAVHIDRTTAYDHRGLDPDFRARWDEAIQVMNDDLEASMRNRATDGTPRVRVDKGRVVYHRNPETDELVRDEQGRPVPLVERVHETALTIFVAKANMREKYFLERQLMLDESSAMSKAAKIREAARLLDLAVPLSVQDEPPDATANVPT